MNQLALSFESLVLSQPPPNVRDIDGDDGDPLNCPIYAADVLKYLMVGPCTNNLWSFVILPQHLAYVDSRNWRRSFAFQPTFWSTRQKWIVRSEPFWLIGWSKSRYEIICAMLWLNKFFQVPGEHFACLHVNYASVVWLWRQIYCLFQDRTMNVRGF